MTETESLQKRWYVVQAITGFEARAKKALGELIVKKGLQDCFGEILVPSESIIEIKAGKRCKSRRKFFPGYLIVQLHLNDSTWELIRSTPHIVGFVGGGVHPVPISDEEAERILLRLREAEEKPRHRHHFEAGEEVRVCEGPFTDFRAVVESVDYAKNRLCVSISIFGRNTPIELTFQQVSKE